MKNKKDTNGFKAFRFICLAILMPLAFIGVNLCFVTTMINKVEKDPKTPVEAVSEIKESFIKADEYLGYIDLENKSINIPKKETVKKVVDKKDTQKEREYNKIAHINRSVYLLSSVEKPADGNMILSEVSLIKALDMLSEGADNDTKAQLLNWVGENEKNVSVADYQSKSVSMNNLFLAREDENFPAKMKQSFKDIMEEKYDSKGRTFSTNEAQQVADEENAWISEKTHGLITDGITKDLIISPDFVASLYNIIYFKGSWREPLGVGSEPMDFTKEDGTVIKARKLIDSGVSYYSNDTVEVYTHNYYNPDEIEDTQRYQFMGILPKKKGTVDLKSLDLINLKEPSGNYNCTVTIPSFEYQFNTSLFAPLKQSGLQFMFDPSKADLSAGFDMKVGTNVYVSDVNQKAKIKFDEFGTEAAAVTEILMMAMTEQMEPQRIKEIQLDFNRPFAYIIWDTKLDVPMFMGIVNSPTEVTE